MTSPMLRWTQAFAFPYTESLLFFFFLFFFWKYIRAESPGQGTGAKKKNILKETSGCSRAGRTMASRLGGFSIVFQKMWWYKVYLYGNRHIIQTCLSGLAKKYISFWQGVSTSEIGQIKETRLPLFHKPSLSGFWDRYTLAACKTPIWFFTPLSTVI